MNPAGVLRGFVHGNPPQHSSTALGFGGRGVEVVVGRGQRTEQLRASKGTQKNRIWALIFEFSPFYFGGCWRCGQLRAFPSCFPPPPQWLLTPHSPPPPRPPLRPRFQFHHPTGAPTLTLRLFKPIVFICNCG